MREIKIGPRMIGDSHPAYIIAEIGLNHQGDVQMARTLIDHAIAAGVDAVKFQKRSLKSTYIERTLMNAGDEEHGTHYTLEHIVKAELGDEEMRELCAYARSREIEFLCSPWDEASLDFLITLDLAAYKIGSADMFNLPLLGKIAALKKPLLISTGMSFMSEIEQVADFLKKRNADFVLLHCNSTYPAPHHDINLNFLKTLRTRYSDLVGYSGHESGITVSCAAVALGARVIERHLTVDKALPGPDHKASLDPDEFAQLVTQIRIVERALGDGVRFPSRGEYMNRETLSKSIVASRDLAKGAILTYEDLALKSPGKGTSPLKLDAFIGKTLTARDVPKDEYVLESDIDLRPEALYKNVRPKHVWGVVARMSDIDTLLHCGSDFVELHLTDADVNNNKEYTTRYDVDVAFHGPEYDGDLLLNLSSLDEDVRMRSVAFFNKALSHARTIKRLFRNGENAVKFVVHPGGMNMEAPLLDHIPQLNENLADSLRRLESDGFEILLENMPGCPWYFGGQWYHANFMDAHEIIAFAQEHRYGLVFDTSHAALYCNYYRKDLNEFARTILPEVRYIHISDGAKFNGEGLQIGDGTIDFKALLEILVPKDVWFLPEIWQGHKFGGEGFVKAVNILKNLNQDF